jgi:TolB-like protein
MRTLLLVTFRDLLGRAAPFGSALLMATVACTAMAEEKTRVAVLGVTGSTPQLTSVGNGITEQILTELGRTTRIDAMGASDVATVLGNERQKEILGCSANASSCLAEVSAALGAPWLVTGTLAQLGKSMRLDIKLIRARDGKAVFRDGKILKDDSAVFDAVTDIVQRMVAKMNLPPPPPTVPEPTVVPSPDRPVTVAEVTAPVSSAEAPSPASNASVAPWILVGVGGAAAIGGGVLVALGGSQRNATLGTRGDGLTTPADDGVLSYATASQRLKGANTMMIAGAIVAGVGALAAASGLTWKVLNGPSATVTIAPGLGAVAVEGRFE